MSVMNIVSTSILAFIVIAIVFGNVMTILAVARTPQLQTISNQFILGLAAADLLIAFALPYNAAMVYYGKGPRGGDYSEFLIQCVSPLIPALMSGIATNIHLLLIFMDRFFALINPLKRRKFMTKKKARIAIGFVFLYATFIAFIMILWNRNPFWAYDPHYYIRLCDFHAMDFNYFLFFFFIPFIALEVVFFVGYGKVFFIAWSKSTTIYKPLKTVFLILGCYSVFWIPLMINMFRELYVVHNASNKADLIKYFRSKHNFGDIAFLLMCCNSFMNPIIYACQSTHFREAFKRILFCRKNVAQFHLTNIRSHQTPNVHVIPVSEAEISSEKS
ncbi:beta-2 adrenergic receptor-like [Neocloeon triangulifer]|uniref:beta-2 adrenergic receptor-like n=1 Tax=Neocloeon triangulifer TaxID=2078957 RepID=UPI00286F6F35|nr:beta-2 adrenergic receptor-like [Neocloeon triangulifer]